MFSKFFQEEETFCENRLFFDKENNFSKSGAQICFLFSKKSSFFKKEIRILFFMTISSPEREAKKVKIAVDRNPVETSFERWACDLKKR